MMGLNLERVTIEDCIEMYEFKNQYAVVNDGVLTGFEQEKIPT